ncbi:MAG: zinc metalloprotease HtpX [Nitrospirae bacterium GWC2_42_7]|nr:MAG: zinc metalloprotease HtpX [Nitrospirae bacterium GWC2_42_7]
MRRIIYFLFTNLAIMIVLSAAMRVFGVEPYLTAYGLNYQSLLIFALVFGMGGSFISLALSKWTAKKMSGAQVIKEPANETERWLVKTVSELATKSNIGMPEVAIFPSEDMNAFATGMSRNKSLVAVSAGLLRKMDKEKVKAVLAHEVAHASNGDMITLALIQGVVNTFVLFLSRVIGHTVDKVVFKNERGHGPAFWITTIIAEIVLAILASIIVFYFSRKREYRADSGAAELVGKKPMAGALEALKASIGQPHLPDKMAAFGISGAKRSGLKTLFATHPDLDDRIAALEASNYPDYK